MSYFFLPFLAGGFLTVFGAAELFSAAGSGEGMPSFFSRL
jgi:hypothetical protein